MPVRSYRELIVWQRAMDLVVSVYALAKRFPHEEQFALCSQIRRAVVSIPANIAEGQGRGGATEFVRFLRIAYASLSEVETHAFIAERLGYVGPMDVSGILDLSGEVGRLLNGLIRSKVPKAG